MTRKWLKTGMFKSQKAPDKKIDRILKELGDHALTKSHARHLSIQRCREIGLKVEDLEKDDDLQDAVLSLHHACMLTFSATGAFKIIENHEGTAFIKLAQPVMLPGQAAARGGAEAPRKQVAEGG